MASEFLKGATAPGFKPGGGVPVPRPAARMTQLPRTAATAEAFDLGCELISPARARELYPILATEDLVGAIWLPGDGTANPTDVTNSLAKGARDRGASVVQGVRVTGIGFFDPTHGQAGVAPNGIELHPVLRIEFPQ